MKTYKIIILVIVITFTLGLINLKNDTFNIKSSFNETKEQQFSLDELNMKKDNVDLFYENRKIKVNLPIGIKNSVYYIPANEVVNNSGGKFTVKNGVVELNFNSIDAFIDVNEGSYKINKKTQQLRHKAILKQKVFYISMFDFTNIFDLKTYWDEKNTEISFYKNTEKIVLNSTHNEGKVALIRLEDIAAGGLYNSCDSLEKLRIIADYLYSKNIVFYVAWVPRYIDPSMNIDNNLLKNYNMFNADFVFTLDYIINRNGIIGLHGYTHQYDGTKSIDGIEFHMSKKDNIPKDTEYAKERVVEAIETAKALDINCDFFEAPHYAILPNQMKVIEKFFKFMYQPYSKDGGFTECSDIVKFNNSERKVIYIPTPLGYLNGKDDCRNMLNKIKNIDDNMLASLFYHPYIEFEYIDLKRNEKGYPVYSYSQDSPLHQILKEFEKNDYKFCTIDNALEKTTKNITVIEDK
ncbi:DUF2334 domain-containing protein [Clostridium sp. DJ247]|nr:DUF2334 domain-containing protein [Clostridium sp. DJ247]